MRVADERRESKANVALTRMNMAVMGSILRKLANRTRNRTGELKRVYDLLQVNMGINEGM